MSDFSLVDLTNLLTCVNESIHLYKKEILSLEDFACRSVLNYTLERDKILAQKIETAIASYNVKV